MSENIEVIFRVRPRNAREISEGEEQSRQVVTFKSQQCIEMENHLDANGKPSVFNFDHVVPPEWSQRQVYELVAPMLDRVFNGVNCCLKSYGQTGSGKSFSIMGKLDGIERGMPELAGIVPRLVTDLFERIKNTPDTEFTVKFSYVEIYNEQIRDLLDTSKTNLKVRAQNGTVWCEGASVEYVQSIKDVIALIDKGTSNRAVSATKMNAESSRSHSIIIITVGQRNESGLTASKLVLVDLAGSERVGKTGAANETLKEAQSINRSLAVLGNVINALSTVPKKGEKIFVPVRESKLTWLLSDCLGGSSKTTILIAASPVLFNLPETYSSALFGSRCKLIKNKVVVNKHLSESEWQRLLDSKVLQLNKLSTILHTTFNDYNLLAQHMSTININKNTDVDTALIPYQKGFVAKGCSPIHPQRDSSWDKYTTEYIPSIYDIPLIIQTIQKNGDLAKILDKVHVEKASEDETIGDLSLTTPSKPSGRFTYTPEGLISPGGQEGEFTLIDPKGPSYIDDITDPIDRGDDNELDMLKFSSPDFIKGVEEMLAENNTNNNISTTSLQPTQMTSQTSITGNNINIDNNNNNEQHQDGLLSHTTRHRSSSQISPDQLPNLQQLKTPTDSLVELLREHFKTDLTTTQELLDLLLQCPDGSTLPTLLKRTVETELLGGGQPTIVPVAAVPIPTTTTTTTSGKQVVKKVVKKQPATTASVEVKAEVALAESPSSLAPVLEDQTQTIVPTEETVNDEEVIVAPATSGKKVVKKVIKKVVEKSEKPTTTAAVTTDEKIEKPETNPEESTTTIITTANDEILAEQQEKVNNIEQEKLIVAINNDPILLQEMDTMKAQLAALQAQLAAANDDKKSMEKQQERLEQDLNNKNAAIITLKSTNQQNLQQIDTLEEEKKQQYDQFIAIQQQQQEIIAKHSEELSQPIVLPPPPPPPVKQKPPQDVVPKTRYQELQQEYVKLKHEGDRTQLQCNAFRKSLTKKQEELMEATVRVQSLWTHGQELERINNEVTTENQQQKEMIQGQGKKLDTLMEMLKKQHQLAIWLRQELGAREKVIQGLQAQPTRGGNNSISPYRSSSYQDLKQYF